MLDQNCAIDWFSVTQSLSDDWEALPAQDSFVLCSVLHGALIIGARPNLVDPDQLLMLLPCFPDSDQTRRAIETVTSGALRPRQAGWYHTLTSFLRKQGTALPSENLLTDLSDDQGFSPLADKNTVRAELRTLRQQLIRQTGHFWSSPKNAMRKLETDLQSRDVPDVVRTLQANPARYAQALPIGKRTTHVNEQLVDLLYKMKLTLGDLK